MKDAKFILQPCILALVVCTYCVPLQRAHAQPAYTWDRVAKAQPDECFQGVGNPFNRADIELGFEANFPNDLSEIQKQQCLEIVPDAQYETVSGYAQPKTNQAYVWGLTRDGTTLWFGTAGNVNCIVNQVYLANTEPKLSQFQVCEGSGMDTRPPRIYTYDTITGVLMNRTQTVIDAGPEHEERLRDLMGLRSAGMLQGSDVVFLSGAGGFGVRMFAFRASTGELIDSITFDGVEGRPLFTNMRQWREVSGELYVGAKTFSDGQVLRWTGDAENPFSFEVVGDIPDSDPAYLAEHQGRLYVSAWPALPGTDSAGLWMSPRLGRDQRLGGADRNKWQSIWNVFDYEPDLASGMGYGGGPLMSFQGWLYWGTMHVPGWSFQYWRTVYGPEASVADYRGAASGTHRAISIFRGRGFGTSRELTQLLYGYDVMPVYDPAVGWETQANNSGTTPKYGAAGFDNESNNYTWWMEVYNDALFVGTMDYSFLRQNPDDEWGADLMQFPSAQKAASTVSRAGVGNLSNYGIRTMVVIDNALYLGSANPMNLMTDPNDTWPEGGWELIELKVAP